MISNKTNMKNTYKLYLLLLYILLLSSCINTKNISMFSTGEIASDSITKLSKVPVHIIKPDDNLFLSVFTIDEKVNAIFNPSTGGGGAGGVQQLFATPAGQYINGHRVQPDGTVTLPIIGKIKFAGLNLDEAQKHLKERAEEYLKEPTVQVKFLNYTITVSGEIARPGIYNNYEESIDIIELISMASGTTNFADFKNITVKRQEDKIIRTYKLDLTDNNVFGSEAFYLEPNDLVYIPPRKIKRRNESSNIYAQVLSTFSTLLFAYTVFLNNKQ